MAEKNFKKDLIPTPVTPEDRKAISKIVGKPKIGKAKNIKVTVDKYGNVIKTEKDE